MPLDGISPEHLETAYLALKFIILIISAPYLVHRSWRYWKRRLIQ